MNQRTTHPSSPLGLLSGLALAAGLLAVGLATPTPAEACGGLFCNNSQPVNQAAERILFSYREDGGVTAVIQIQYEGPSEKFAWVLPVQGAPEVGISSDAAFQRLQQATNPQYQLNTRVEGTCEGGDRSFGAPTAAPGSAAEDSAGGGGSDGVNVVDRGTVGPYDYVTLEVDESAMDKFEIVSEWLDTNGYDISALGPDTLRPYLEAGMNLLAFRLTKGNDSGSVRPVVIDFGPGSPSIPIRPTAVAANDDMGVMVWVAAEQRAVPANYAHLELNEALIDWLNPNNNYNDVVTRAANEGGGQGFVTEMAGPTEALSDVIFPSWQADQWDRISGTDWTDREASLVIESSSTFGNLDGFRDALASQVRPPAGVMKEDFLECPSCYLDASTELEGFDPAAFIAAVQEEVIDPMVKTAELLESQPYVTRLYTTMSADEMTMDPIFTLNDTLGDHSNVHTADRIIECSAFVSMSEAPWRVELPDGTLVVRGRGTTWPFSVEDETLPANERITRVGETGTGEVVTDNSDAIAATVAEHNEAMRSGGLCSVGHGPARGAPWVWLGLAGLVVVIRRRRAR